MQVSAVLKGVHLSPQKARLVADLVRGKKVDNALNILQFSPKKGAEIIKKVLESAIANAEHNNGADIDELKFSILIFKEAARSNNSFGKSFETIAVYLLGFGLFVCIKSVSRDG